MFYYAVNTCYQTIHQEEIKYGNFKQCIGANGNWYVENEDTGVKAQGPEGEQGPVGP